MNRIRTRPARSGLVALAVVAVGLLATGAGSSVAAENRTGGTLTIGLAEDPDALDPTLARTFVGRMVFLHMCEKLYDLNARLQIVPQLAAGMPTLSGDKRRMTIRIRRGIRFNDGTLLNARAVKISLDRHRTLAGSARASEISPVTSVDVVGNYTVRLNLNARYSPLTAQLADRAGMIMSPKQLDALGTRFASNPVCVGPFKFTSRTAGDRIVLDKSQFYYARSKVKLNRIVFRIITDTSARAANLRAHDINVLDRIASTDLPAIQRDRSLRVLKATSIGYQGISINIGNKNGIGKPFVNVGTPLASRRALRQAFELSLDRRVINRVVFGGTVLPGCLPVPPASPYYDARIKCPGRNLSRARSLIRSTGMSTPVHVRLMIGTDQVAARLGQVIQSMAREAGFQVDLQPTEFVTALRRQDQGNYDAFAIGWSGRVDPDGNIYQFVHSKGSLNNLGWGSGRMDLLLDNARKAATLKARKTLYSAAFRVLRSELPLIYLYHPVNRHGVTANVKGVRLYGDGLIRAYFAEYK
ncbi:MAG TPA: ABC transporter substrate-binding protein [Gaiellaceae bacterium]|nr:ABC transporter substrate-binding protein [Gaiellaceae bacterium]